MIPKLILCVLAVYRFAHAMSFETGPGALFYRIREHFAHYVNDDGAENWRAEFWHCPLCQSFWLSGCAALIVFWGAPPVDVLLIWCGIAGAVLVLHRLIYR